MNKSLFKSRHKWIVLLGVVSISLLSIFVFIQQDFETLWSLPKNENGNYYEIRISPDGNNLLGVKNNRLELFDLKSKQLKWQIDKNFLPTIAWLDNEQVIAAPSEPFQDLRIYSRGNGTVFRETIFGLGCIDICCYGEIIVGTTGDTLEDFLGPGQPFVLRRQDLRQFVIEDAAGGFETTFDCKNSSGLSVTACQIKENQYRIAVTQNIDCPAKVCSLTMTKDSYIEEPCPPSITARLIQEIAVPNYSRIALSKDGSFLVTLSQQGVVKYNWNENAYQQVKQFKTLVDVNNYGKCLSISPDSRYIASCTGNGVIILRAKDLQLCGRIRSPSYAVCFTPDSKQLAVGHHSRVDAYRIEP